MTTLAVPSHSFSHALTHALTEAPHRRGTTGRAFFGPSPFEVPESAYVVLRGPNELTFLFNYGGKEEPERFERQAALDATVAVRLGEKTRRILQLSLRRDIRAFSPAWVTVDAEYLLRDITDAPRSILQAVRGNAAIVQGIVGMLPDEFIAEVRESAARQARDALEAEK